MISIEDYLFYVDEALEAFGYTRVYDYVVGKSDWLAAGLPTEGDRPPPAQVADAMDRSVPTCTPDERIADVIARLAPSSSPVWVVVNDQRVVQGRLRPNRIDPAHKGGQSGHGTGAATVRADADLADTVDRMKSRKVQSLIASTLYIAGASAAIDFYTSVLGATERMRMPGPEGTIGHAEIHLGNSVIMMSDEHLAMGVRGPKSLGGTPVALNVYVKDVDDVFKRALDAGATGSRRS